MSQARRSITYWAEKLPDGRLGAYDSRGTLIGIFNTEAGYALIQHARNSDGRIRLTIGRVALDSLLEGRLNGLGSSWMP